MIIDLPEVPQNTLNNGQVFALLRMTKALQSSVLLECVSAIKAAIESDDLTYAQQVWGDLTEDEQTDIWVAPKFGGIFTTDERKIIKGGFKND